MSDAQTSLDTQETRALIENFQSAFAQIRARSPQDHRRPGRRRRPLLMTLLVGGHCLITGMPGTAKTLLVRTLAKALGLTFKRIQFTPDLMPTDVTGTDIIEEDVATGHAHWTFVPGPIFTNVLLADEINRTPPKTQAALARSDAGVLSVTVRGTTYHAAAAVLRARHAEPDRAGRHLSAARSAARPFPVQRGARLPFRRRRGGRRGRPQHDAYGPSGDQGVHDAARRSCSSNGWSARCRFRNRPLATPSTWYAPRGPTIRRARDA